MQKKIFGIFLDLPAYVFAFICMIFRIGNLGLVITSKPCSKSCAILGNGPSLKTDIDRLASRTDDFDFFSVNHFADSEHYEAIRPVYYIFVDPYFWRKDAHQDFIRKRTVTFANIVNKTTWPITIFIPSNADAIVFDTLRSNKNIRLRRYLNNQLRGAHSDFSARLLLTGVFSPFAINVLIHAIFVTIRLGYKKIVVFGADTSWYKDFFVDQKNNRVSMRFSHFYGEEHRDVFHDCTRSSHSTMDFEMWKIYETFTWYRIMSRYGLLRGVSVLNGSNTSDIDVFLRYSD